MENTIVRFNYQTYELVHLISISRYAQNIGELKCIHLPFLLIQRYNRVFTVDLDIDVWNIHWQDAHSMYQLWWLKDVLSQNVKKIQQMFC